MIPISDEKRTGKFPFFTTLLILLNIIIFFATFSRLELVIKEYGFVPKKIENGEKFLTFFSSLFIHASFFHLFGNLWFLWLFGDNVEAKIGRLKFLVLYFLSGFGSLILFSLMAENKNVPVVGSSGAVSGILGAYSVLFPKNKIKALVPIFYFWKVVYLPAIFYVGIWFLYQFLSLSQDSSIAYWAHIGGFLTGIILIKILEKKKFKL